MSTPPASSCASSFVDDEEPADVDVSLVAVLDAPLDFPSPSPQDEDDASRMTNYIPSITHSDDSHVLLAPEDAAFDLGSLGPDLRDAIVRKVYPTQQLQQEHQTSPCSDSGARSVGSADGGVVFSAHSQVL